MTLVESVGLVASAAGAAGALLVFVEFFQLPSYVEYDRGAGEYTVAFAAENVRTYTWIGRVGALLLALSFTLQFLVGLSG